MSKLTNNNADTIKEELIKSRKILINSDTRTDLDSLCSTFVLKQFLKFYDIDTKAIHAGQPKENTTKFIPEGEILFNTDISTIDLKDFDLVVCLDSGDSKHISVAENYVIPEGVRVINIDHHSTNDYFGRLNYVYELGSCCSVIYKFFKEIKFDVPDSMIRNLVVGMVTDTGFFKYNSTKSEDFEFLAEFMKNGINVPGIIASITSEESLDQLNYKKLVYKNLLVLPESKIAYSTLSLGEIHAEKIDLQKVYVRHADLIKYISGVDVSFVVSEVESSPKYLELSFRSKDNSVDVSVIAKHFGGGGHPNGSGAKLYGNYSVGDGVKIVLEKLKEIGLIKS